MKKILAGLLLVLFLVTSCSKDERDLAEAIPASAELVACVNTPALLKKLDDDNLKKMFESRLGDLKKDLQVEESRFNFIVSLLKDPESAGLNLSKQIYVYQYDGVDGFLLALSDRDKFKETLLQLDVVVKDDVREKDGISSVNSPEGLAFAWDDSRLLVQTTNSGDNADLFTNGINQLKQEKEASIASNELFKKSQENLKDVNVYRSFKIEDGKNIIDVVVQADMVFEKGEVKGTSKVLSDVNDLEVFKKMFGVVEGKHSKYHLKDAFTLEMNIKGSGLDSYLNQSGLLGNSLGLMAGSVEKVISNLDGDVSLIVTNTEEGFMQMPTARLYAEIKDPKVISEVLTGWSVLMPITKKSETSYSVSGPVGNVQIDVNGSTLSVGLGDATSLTAVDGGKPSRDYLIRMVGSNNIFGRTQFAELGQEIQHFEFVMYPSFDTAFTVGFKNKNENSFVTVIKTALNSKRLF